jgi:hypothetical protein
MYENGKENASPVCNRDLRYDVMFRSAEEYLRLPETERISEKKKLII